MSPIKHVALVLACVAVIQSAPAGATEVQPKPALSIDVPVQLKPSKVVFNMDHLAFAGDQVVGLNYMKLMLKAYNANETPIQIVAVFHGAAGYMLLNDQAYDRVRKSDTGNPYKEQIAALIREGVQFEECGQTAKSNGWTNSDLLPGIKVNSGANLRLVQLMQDGFVQLQP